MEWQTTTTLLRELADDGNDSAWRLLVGRFWPLLVRFAQCAGLSAGDAEDVAQESLKTFLESFRRGEFDAGRGRLSAWLFGIARNHVLRAREQSARHAVRQGRPLDSSFGEQQSDGQNALAELWEDSLWQVCAGLVRDDFEPVTYRAFELVVRDELPPAEAAAALGVSVKTVYNAKHRVLQRIRERRADLDAAM